MFSILLVLLILIWPFLRGCLPVCGIFCILESMMLCAMGTMQVGQIFLCTFLLFVLHSFRGTSCSVWHQRSTYRVCVLYLVLEWRLLYLCWLEQKGVLFQLCVLSRLFVCFQTLPICLQLLSHCECSSCTIRHCCLLVSARDSGVLY